MINKQLLGKRSVKKGKWYEAFFARELSRLLNAKFTRTIASEKRLKVFTGDIVCLDKNRLYFTDLSFQVKAREAGNPFAWWSKAKDDAEGKLPIVIWQKANKPVLAIMSIEDLCKILYELDGYRQEFKGRTKEL